MSDGEKVIRLDPISLKIPDANKSRKKRESTNKIKVKSAPKTPKASTIKKNLLNIIRKNQQKRLKEYFPDASDTAMDDRPAKGNFAESVDFMRKLEQSEPVIKHVPQNQTFKMRPQLPVSQLIAPAPPFAPLVQQPQYGCLKNGNLPTFRTWKNQTQKQVAHHRKPLVATNATDAMKTNDIDYEKKLETKIQEIGKLQQFQTLRKNDKKKVTKPKKQKRIKRRTFRVGKSKVHPRVSVLVSNRTLRSNANLKKQQLKETNMKDVRRYLLKQGFIKVGTSTPNDVLRQMYENANMICGEVKNYNPENLLYNYFNDKESSLS